MVNPKVNENECCTVRTTALAAFAFVPRNKYPTPLSIRVSIVACVPIAAVFPAFLLLLLLWLTLSAKMDTPTFL